MGFLIGLIFKNNNTLRRYVSKYAYVIKTWTYETNIPSRDDKRDACNGDECQLPAIGETNNRTTNQAGNALDNCAERDASETVDLLRVIGERGSESTRLRQDE